MKYLRIQESSLPWTHTWISISTNKSSLDCKLRSSSLYNLNICYQKASIIIYFTLVPYYIPLHFLIICNNCPKVSVGTFHVSTAHIISNKLYWFHFWRLPFKCASQTRTLSFFVVNTPCEPFPTFLLFFEIFLQRRANFS